MEIGSSSSSSTSSDSLNGLKFGQKIYFEDVGVGVPAKYGGAGQSVAVGSGLTPPKKGRSVVQGGQPPRCQVEGCKVDLSDAKAYYSRHKVCGMHSKSPMVIVAGLEQRFCQQCSRFHQLPEFDQGKRSCRRRLAGHNERRRKPPPGSLLSSRFGRLSSSIFGTENNSRTGSFVMDFTAYPRQNGRDSWPSTRVSEWVPSNQPTATAKFVPHPWQSNSESPHQIDLFLQGSVGGTGYAGPGIPSGECFTGVSSDSGCALSLLSNQPWDSRNRPSSLGVNNLMNGEGSSVIQSPAPSSAGLTHFSSIPWGFKGSEGPHEMPPDLGLGQISESSHGQYSSELDLATHSGRHYMELDLSRGYDSSAQHMHWSL